MVYKQTKFDDILHIVEESVKLIIEDCQKTKTKLVFTYFANTFNSEKPKSYVIGRKDAICLFKSNEKNHIFFLESGKIVILRTDWFDIIEILQEKEYELSSS